MRLQHQDVICRQGNKSSNIQGWHLGFKFTKGTSLITVLVAMTILLLIVSAALQWFQGTKRVQIEMRNKEHSLTNARTALQFFSSDLRAAGYKGCRTLDDNFPIHLGFIPHASTNKFLRMDRAVFGFYASVGACFGRMPSTICNRLKAGTDVLVVYQVPQKILALKEKMNTAEDAIQTIDNNAIRKGSLVFISDCEQGDLFIVSEVEGHRIFHQQGVLTNRSDALSKAYGANAEVVELQTIAYYVGLPVRAKIENKKTFSLYRDDLLHEAEEMLEGVSDFQTKFGVRVANGAILYKSMKDMEDKDWPYVQSVRLKVILEKKAEWEYEFEIRNRRRFNFNADINDMHFRLGDASLQARSINL